MVDTRGNDVILDVGRDDGVSIGDRVEIFDDQPIDLGDGELAYERHTIAIGEVTALTRQRALVRLGLNEFAPIGATALPASGELTATRRSPPRTGGYWSLAATSRLFVVTRAVGGGLLGDGAVSYMGERPFFLRLLVPPSGLTVHRDSQATGDELESAWAGSMVGLAGFDHRFFGIGAGFGATRVLSQERAYDDLTLKDASVGFTFMLHMRIGTLDGLHLAGELGMTTVLDASQLSHLDLRMQIPFTERLALVARGGSGFGVTGVAYADFAARMRVRGEGGSGTLFVAPFLGFARLAEVAAVYGDEWHRNIEGVKRPRGGPSAGVSLEYRL